MGDDEFAADGSVFKYDCEINGLFSGCQLTTGAQCPIIRAWDFYMGRNTHPKKEVDEALEYAEAQGWTVEKATGHAWGRLYCPYNDAECRCGEFCIVSVWSTPENPSNHARQLKRVVDNCPTHRRMLEAAKKSADSE